MGTTTLLVIVLVVLLRRRRIHLQTQGLSRKGGSLVGIIRPLTTRTPRSHRAVAGVDARQAAGVSQGPSRATLRSQSRSTTLRRELLIFNAPL
jgi:hypothetical protein